MRIEFSSSSKFRVRLFRFPLSFERRRQVIVRWRVSRGLIDSRAELRNRTVEIASIEEPSPGIGLEGRGLKSIHALRDLGS